MPVVWSDRCLLHEPAAEIWVGVRTSGGGDARARGTRSSRRSTRAMRRGASRTRRRAARGSRPGTARLPGLGLGGVGGGRACQQEPGRVPYVFAHRGLRRARAPRRRCGRSRAAFAYDTMTLIGPGTWEAARAAVDAALTAVDLVAGGEARRLRVLAGRRAITSPARPYGGSCYLNNAAIAAAALCERLDAPVAVARRRRAPRQRHAGDLLRARRRARTGSVHVDPAAGWFPHFLGFAETRGDGAGANRNLPLAAGRRRRRLARGGRRARAAGRAGAARRSSSRSASTPPPATRRARSR